MPDREPVAAGLSAPGTDARIADTRRASGPLAIALAPSLLASLLLLARVPDALDGMDSVNFALALRDYDPGLEQPHWPGYPLYIATARALLAAGASESLALALPGILAAPLLLLATASIALRSGLAAREALAACAILCVHPLLLDQGPRPIPDLLGSALAWSAIALLARGRPRAGGALLGLALGVRVDLAPLAAAAFAFPAATRRAFAGSCALAAALWAVPLLAAAPPEWLPSLARFAGRHFTVWGSTLIAGAGSRTAALDALDLLGPGIAALLGSALGALALPGDARRLLAWAAGSCALWVAVGQNLAHARHWLPLLPAVCLCLSHALASLPGPRARALAAGAVLLAALPAYTRTFTPAPDGRALVERTLAACERCTAIFVCDEKRFFDRYAPRAAVYRRARLAEIALDAAAWGPALDGVVGVTSSVEGADRPGWPGTWLAPGIVLYRVPAAELR